LIQVPCFWIGNVPIYGDLILAPMAGYSDVPTRAIAREMGSALSYSPVILDDGVVQRSRKTRVLTDFTEAERPVAIQMLGKTPERVIAACQALLPKRPDLFDLNLGCPARRVSSHGRGAAMLTDLDHLAHYVGQIVRALPMPVTAKIRLGWDDESLNYLEVARILEDAGVAAIAVHGRTKEQGYSGRANWEAIAEVKRAVKIPVLANGDVRTVADIAAIKAQTGCEAVLIGRGAVGNPWIFARRDQADVPYAERLAMIRRHLAAMQAYHGERVGLLIFRKHAIHYIQGFPGVMALRPRLFACETADALLDLLDNWQPGEGE